MKMIRILLATLLLWSALSVTDSKAQSKNQILQAVGMPVDPKVPILWYRYYDSKGLYAMMQKIAKAYPKLAKLSSVGKSYQGRDIWCLTITDFSNGKPDEKPGIYLDGNIHGNEIQGSEFSLYTAWYLTEMAASNTVISELLHNKVFYILPSINPDARDHFIHVAGDQGSPRFSMKMNDDEGMPNDVTNSGHYNWTSDLDGDRHLNNIRIQSPKGEYIVNPKRPWQLIRDSKAKNEMRYSLIADEGILKPNPKGKFGLYDLNRNWYWWFGAEDSIKIHTKAPRDLISYGPFPQKEQQVVRDFFLSHPNISIAESFHNAKGSFFRARAVRYTNEDSTKSDRIDELVYDTFGKKGEEICPGYEYSENKEQRWTLYRSIDWMYGARGAYAFLPELYSPIYALYHQKQEVDSAKGIFIDSVKRIFDNISGSFHDELLFGDGFIPWHKVQHPSLGEAEVGGTKKTYGRIHPGFMILEDAHRQMAFTLYMAMRTAKVEIVNYAIKPLAGTKQEVSVVIRNSGMLPTHSSPDLKHGIIPPDLVTINNASKVLQVISAPSIHNTANENTGTVKIANIPGNGEVKIIWIVEGKGDYQVAVKSIRGGVAKQQIKLSPGS